MEKQQIRDYDNAIVTIEWMKDRIEELEQQVSDLQDIIGGKEEEIEELTQQLLDARV